MRPGKKLGTVKMLGREIDVLDSLGWIDLHNTAQEVEEAGGVATWWGEVSAITHRRANDLERQMDYIRADLRRKVRAGAVARMEKITVDAVDDEVTVHPQYQQAVKDYHEALEAYEKAESNKFISSHKQVQLQGYASRVLAELAALGPPAGAPPLPTRRAVRS